MPKTRKRRITQINQMTVKHEKQMFDALSRALRLLAREIEARWTPGEYSLMTDSLNAIQSKISSMIFRYGVFAAGESAQLVIQHFGTKSALEIAMEQIREWLRGYSDQRAKIITDYLRSQIEEKIARGGSDAQILKEITALLNSKGAAERIARTETHGAVERGAYEAARSLGVRLVKEWASLEDNRTRLDHALADGQLQEIETPFIVGGERLRYPGDDQASASQTVNCRCTALYHLITHGELKK